MFPGAMRIGAEEERVAMEVIRSRKLLPPCPGLDLLSEVERLEVEVADRIGSLHAVAVNSGTSALMCALVGLGIGPGDEVIVPAFTWISTATAVLGTGAVPVIAEIDSSLTLDPNDVKRKISRHTRALIAVHMRGAPCDIDTLADLAQTHGLLLIEDVAQATGGSYQGHALGSIGEVGAFSLQYNKIITCGEGGLVTTSKREIFNKALMYRDPGEGLR